MGRKRKNTDGEVMEELVRIIRASPAEILRALMAEETVPDCSALATVKCKRSADGSSEWEVKTADKLKAIELYLRFSGGKDAGGLSPGVTVEYDYG